MKALTAADLIVTEVRTVDDPMETPAQLIAKRAKASDKLIGKLSVTGNAMTRIGALCYVKERLGHHERAAEWLKTEYEALYGAVTPAIDAGRIRVDTTIMAHDNGIALRIDRSRDLRDVFNGLGHRARDRIIACVCCCIPAGSDVPLLPSGKPNWRLQQRAVRALLDDLDFVAEWKGWKTA